MYGTRGRSRLHCACPAFSAPASTSGRAVSGEGFEREVVAFDHAGGTALSSVAAMFRRCSVGLVLCSRRKLPFFRNVDIRIIENRITRANSVQTK